MEEQNSIGEIGHIGRNCWEITLLMTLDDSASKYFINKFLLFIYPAHNLGSRMLPGSSRYLIYKLEHM
jgi:hypothetical protein